MRAFLMSTVIGITLITPALAQDDISRMLQGLTGSNSGDNERLHEAYRRGYEHGQRDMELQMRRAQQGGNYSNEDPRYRPPPPPRPYPYDRN